MSAFTLIVHLQSKPDQVDQFMAMALENATATRSRAISMSARAHNKRIETDWHTRYAIVPTAHTER